MTLESNRPAISAVGLVKNFGKTRALDGFDLEVAPGTVLGLLGPNGAGKTTAVRIFTTLLVPDGGHAEVAGLDCVRDANRLRGSSPVVGSSRNSTGGVTISEAARSRRRRMPPE
jgi:ABC-type multidrug transport system ATPase subunit